MTASLTPAPAGAGMKISPAAQARPIPPMAAGAAAISTMPSARTNVSNCRPMTSHTAKLQIVAASIDRPEARTCNGSRPNSRNSQSSTAGIVRG